MAISTRCSDCRSGSRAGPGSRSPILSAVTSRGIPSLSRTIASGPRPDRGRAAAAPSMDSTPGRSCPRHYRYSPAVFARAADLEAQSLYIVGGLYGNPFALEAVLAMARRESATLVFNGDFNWFNVDPAGFGNGNETVLRHAALRGNRETQIAREDQGGGRGR